MAMWTPRLPRTMMPLSLKSNWCTLPSEGGCARKEVYFCKLLPKKDVTRPCHGVRSRRPGRKGLLANAHIHSQPTAAPELYRMRAP